MTSDQVSAEPLDAFHRHEALHTAHIVAEMFDSYIADHPFVGADPELKEAASRLSAGLHGLYQAIASKSES